MGESITEGTLIQWHKNIGEHIKRDEHMATIETDKIDVPVNSPEAGVLSKVFYSEGSTCLVGSNLFEIIVDSLSVDNTLKPDSTPDIVETIPKPQDKSQEPLKKHVPLIKFLGKRTKLVKPVNEQQPIKKITFENIHVEQVPLIVSDAECDAINSGFYLIK